MQICSFIVFKEYVESGSNRKKQQNFQNVINEPLLKGQPDQEVLGLIAVPELHLLIGFVFTIMLGSSSFNLDFNKGVVDKLMKSIEDNLLPTKEEGLDFMDSFLKQVIKIYI